MSLAVLQEALIHLGAKFSPCMRQDEEIHNMMQEKRAKERESGCCVRNDRSGCLQTLQEECSVSQQQFLKLEINLINVTLKSCRWKLYDRLPGLFCAIEHSCCVGEVASTSQCSFPPWVVTAARCSLPSGPQVPQKEPPSFYTHLCETFTALCFNPELLFRAAFVWSQPQFPLTSGPMTSPSGQLVYLHN